MVATLSEIMTDREKNNPDYQLRFKGIDFIQVRDLTVADLNHLYFILEKEGAFNSSVDYNIFQPAKVWDILATRCLDKDLPIF
jgi:hypothetical protein